MSSKTNFQKIREFHQTSDLDNHFEHQLDVFDNKKLIKLRIALIEEELNELKEAINQRDFVEVRDAIADILYVTYGAAASFGINADNDYAKVHNSNMTKFCETKELAEKTVEEYKKKYSEGDLRYDTPSYRLSGDGKYYVVYNESSGKILKSINYKQVDLTDL